MSELNPTELEIAKIQEAADTARELLATEFQAQLSVVMQVIERWQREFAAKFVTACQMLEERSKLEIELIGKRGDMERDQISKRGHATFDEVKAITDKTIEVFQNLKVPDYGKSK